MCPQILRFVPVAALAVLVFAAGTGVASAGPGDGYASAGGGQMPSGTGRKPDFTNRLQGVDVSNWNTIIHWGKVKADGMDFAIAKASQGTGYTDPYYAKNHAGAHAAGIHFTAYEFADPNKGLKDPVQDAAHFVKVANLRPSDLVPVLDLEQTGGLSHNELIDWTTAWCNAVHHRLGVWPLIYTSPSFWTDHLNDTTSLAALGDQLWVAHWFVDDPLIPAADWNSSGWTLWQWTDRGHVNGITGRVDMDLLDGTSFDAITISKARAQTG